MGKFIAVFVFVLGLVLSANPSYGEEATSKEKSQRWGIGFHAGYFGMPDFVLDRFFAEHPSVSGATMGIDIKYYGDNGQDRSFNWLFSLDYGKFSGDGYWKVEEGDALEYGEIEGSLISLTATAIWNIFPTKMLNPYLGIGLGVGYLDGVGRTRDEEEEVSQFVPVVHIPIGLNLKASEKFHLNVEGGFRDGIYMVGGIRILF
ncbi:MAG: hypothetical protein AABY44_03110 [Nitrospirota bacterium]